MVPGKHTLVKHHFYPITASGDYLSFKFESVSEKRKIAKGVEYVPVAPNVFNLAFGDIDDNGELDDLSLSDNGDMAKVLATVVQTALIFFEMHPDKSLYFTGSSLARTRLYRALVAREIENWRDVFVVEGILKDKLIPFQIGMPFEAFIIRRKD